MSDSPIQEGRRVLGGRKDPPNTPKPDIQPVGTSPVSSPPVSSPPVSSPPVASCEPVFGDPDKTRWRVRMAVEFTAVAHGAPDDALWKAPYDALKNVLAVLRKGGMPSPQDLDILRSNGLIVVRRIACIQEPMGA